MPKPNRRDFLSATAAAGAVLAAPHVAGAAGSDKKDIRVAVIGVKGRGKSHISAMNKNVVAMCDVDSSILDERAADFAKKHGREVEKFTDFRDLLRKDSIDAVSIATPNHTHSLISIEAIKAGKDVYVEKPVSHNVWEGRQLAIAAEQSGRIVQCGTQSRSNKSLQDAVAWVQGGALGKIKYVLGTCYKPRKAIGKTDKPLNIPSSIDYDLWCGPADKVDLFRPQLHYDWHWDYNTGAGDMGNQGIHQMDIARWFLGEKDMAPRSFSVGARLGYEDGGNTANTQTVVHAYESAPLIFETRGLPRSKEAQSDWGNLMDRYRGARIGVVVQCEGGYVVSGNYRYTPAYDNSGKLIKEFRGGGDPFGNFLSAVAAQDASRLNAPVREGHISSALCHAGNVSHMLGEQAKYGDIAKAVAADDLLYASVDRMAGHLRANDVEIDRQANLVLGKWIEVDTTNDTLVGDECDLWKREGREGFKVPSMETA